MVVCCFIAPTDLIMLFNAGCAVWKCRYRKERLVTFFNVGGGVAEIQVKEKVKTIYNETADQYDPIKTTCPSSRSCMALR